MVRELTPADLQHDSEEIIRALEAGESFLLTHDGVPVGEIVPIERHTFVPAEDVARLFSGLRPINYGRFRRDLDEYIDQDPSPRA